MSPARSLASVRQGGARGRIAFESGYANVLRGGARPWLAAAGVATGVAIVLVMWAVAGGLRTAVAAELLLGNPDAVYVSRVPVTATQCVAGDPSACAWRRNPPLGARELAALRGRPSVRAVVAHVPSLARIRVGARPGVPVRRDRLSDGWPLVTDAEVTEGRTFSRREAARGTRVVLLGDALARRLFGEGHAVGERVRLDGAEWRVIGVYRLRGLPPDAERGGGLLVRADGVVAPLDPSGPDAAGRAGLALAVLPRAGVPGPRVRGEVRTALRAARRLRGRASDTFALFTATEVVARVNEMTARLSYGVVALSSLGLLIGSAGVAVTVALAAVERRVEIGVRRSVGATRVDVAALLLAEALLIAGGGAILGVAAGYAAVRLLVVTTGAPVAATSGAVLCTAMLGALAGAACGAVPAWRAARVDPSSALRME